MQSEAAGMFNNPNSGKEGHAMLAATLAKMQTEHEAGQEAAIQENAQQKAAGEHNVSHQQIPSHGSLRLSSMQTGQPLQTSKAHSWDHDRGSELPGPNGFGPLDAPEPMTGMHSGELPMTVTMSATPILGSSST